MHILIGIGIFIAIVFLVEGIYFTYLIRRESEQKKIKKKLRTFSTIRLNNKNIDILRKQLLSEISWFNKLLLKLPRLKTFDRLIEQSNVRYPLGVYLLLSALFGVSGYIIGSLISINIVLHLVLSACLGSIPFVSVYVKKKKRMQKFERQLPDALDLLVRALKAGHAFSGGIKMVADEFEDPVGTEFARVMDEINFGVGVPEALVNLAERVDCPDLKFFIVSVIVQRETGGNLAEILTKISQIIRERFRLNGRVKVLSAEGKLSAYGLIALPFFMAFYLGMFSPNYLEPLLVHPAGRIMIAGGIIMMILGIIVMKRMVAIKV